MFEDGLICPGVGEGVALLTNPPMKKAGTQRVDREILFTSGLLAAKTVEYNGISPRIR
jgi:hypothetical protein